MVFIWRGSGITVPIFLFISGWIVSYWFDDTRLGNYPFVGWTMLWAGIILTLQGAAVWGGGAPDPDTGEVPLKRGHDFFWIPVLLWGLGFIGLSIWLINKEPDTGYGESYTPSTEVLEDLEEMLSAQSARMVNFYNPYEDTIYLEISDAKTKEYVIGADIPPYSTRYKEFDLKKYKLDIDGKKDAMRVEAAKGADDDDYTELWFILNGGADMILLDVTDACERDITEEEIRDIKWTRKIKDRYDGEKMIAPFMKSSIKEKRTMLGVGDALPDKHRRSEKVYALIVVDQHDEVSEEFLDDRIVYLQLTKQPVEEGEEE